MNELKSCPCCGNVNITCENMSRTTQRPFWVISCCVQSRRLSKKDCVEGWNKRPESAWEMFGILYNKYGLEKILPILAVMTKCAAPASILLEFIQMNKEQQAKNKIKEIEKELKA